MSEPRISVVLPVRDGEAHLRAAIASVLSQTFEDWELIVVDDASGDASRAIAEEAAAADPRVRVVANAKNLRLPRSLNRGFELARGVYRTWTSHDNEYLPDAFAKLLAAIEAEPRVGLAYADFARIDEAGEVVSEVRLAEPDDIVYANCVGPCFLYSAEVAARTGGYRPELELVEDYEYWLRLSRLTRFRHVPELLYRYRAHERSLSATRESEVALLDVRMRQSVIRLSDVADRERYFRGMYERLYPFERRVLRIPGLWWQAPAIFVSLLRDERARIHERRRQEFYQSPAAALLSRIKQGLYRVLGISRKDG